MRITVQFDTDNAAFEDYGIEQECAQILGQATRKLGSITFGEVVGEEQVPLLDSNGNKVGFVRVADVS